MIDPHAHCRDWAQNHKETIEHALSVAERIGLSGIFDMPNTSPPITTRELIEKRLEDAGRVKSPVFYGLYAGLTSDKNQIKEAVKAWREFFPRVVGLKMFTVKSGPSNLEVSKGKEQKLVYQTLSEEGYEGVLVVHCEKEALLKPNLWNPLNPSSHSYARPPKSEVISIVDQLLFADDLEFKGKLHIAHVSVPESVELIGASQRWSKVKVSCGVTPHHCLLNYELIPASREGLLYKVNPPLRNAGSSKKMLELLKQGKIDWIETDHAPHTLNEKLNPPYMSGFPGLPFYPHFLDFLKAEGFSEEQIRNLAHDNIISTFGFNLPERNISPNKSLHSEYEVDVYKNTRREK